MSVVAEAAVFRIAEIQPPQPAFRTGDCGAHACVAHFGEQLVDADQFVARAEGERSRHGVAAWPGRGESGGRSLALDLVHTAEFVERGVPGPAFPQPTD